MGRRGKDRRIREKAREFMEKEAHDCLTWNLKIEIQVILYKLNVKVPNAVERHGYLRFKFEAAMGWRDPQTLFS